ncbi:MAG: hypothetical protein R3F55_04410 [Alphaproteobacteria bacterium]
MAGPSELGRITLWKGDGWHCRVCGRPMFFAPALEQLEGLNPGHGYFHGHGNEGDDLMLPLFARCWAMAIHLSHAGPEEPEESRYVSCCWECMVTRPAVNDIRHGRTAPPPPLGDNRTGWDGFCLLHLALPDPKPRWAKAIRAAYGLA